jgi:hypothetical protein
MGFAESPELTSSAILVFLQTWTELGPMLQYGPTIILLILILGFLLRALPAWKEVKLKELDLKGTDIETRGQEAKALEALAIVLRDVAVEQRKATEETKRATETIDILQRVNSDVNDRLAASVAFLNDRLERIEKMDNLSNRVGALEANVQSAGTTA